MKYYIKNSKVIQIAIIMLSVFFLNTALNAQTKTAELDSFRIIVETTDFGIKLISEGGCAWQDLSFSIDNDKSQTIDASGMANTNHGTRHKSENLADFLIILTKLHDGILLKGIKGTAWKELKFSLDKNGQQAFDQYGMISGE